MSVMTTSEPVVLAQASETQRRDADLHRPSASRRPSAGEGLEEVLPLISAPAFFGPPVIVVLGPWLLLVFLLIGPVALLITFVLVAAVAAGVLGVLVALIASPYLLLRYLRHGPAGARAAAGPGVLGAEDGRPVKRSDGTHLAHVTSR
jgi:hypothetical protein